jgi:hypothetical protein
VFGYAAIKPVLIDEGAFKELCTSEELKHGVSPCYQQEIRLNLMFTVAAVSTNVAALPIGKHSWLSVANPPTCAGEPRY